MMNLNLVSSDELKIVFNAHTRSIELSHLNPDRAPGPQIEFREDVLRSMTFDQAAQFIGERVLLLMPSARDLYDVSVDD